MKQSDQQIERLFEAVLDLENDDLRAAYLDQSCTDPDVRHEVESLLANFNSPESIFEEGFDDQISSRVEMVGAKIDRYKLMEQVGEGGCGVVYVAEQTHPIRRRVALKVIKLGMDTKQLISRFEGERQALAMMDHPNIAMIHDAGSTPSGRPYFVMELVRGIRITDYCDQTQLSMRGRLDLFIKVCQAIHHAHQKGIIHRDIKPSNILVTLHNGVPEPKIIDFGIAKLLPQSQESLSNQTVYTQLHQFIGTPAYMSPEQASISGQDVDTRSDIYSLGVLLYEMMTGRPPFDGDELATMGLDLMCKTIREVDPLKPSTRLGTLRGDEQTTTAQHRSTGISKLITFVRGDLDWIVMKCLDKDPARRYESANELAQDITCSLNQEPISARPASQLYRLQKAYHRNKLIFVAAFTVVVSLALGFAISTFQAIKATRAEFKQSEMRTLAVESLEREAAERKRAQAAQIAAIESKEKARRLLYVADMNLAQEAFEQNNLGMTRRILNRHRPSDQEEDLRGWDWRHLWLLTRSEVTVTLTNRSTAGYCLNFSHDGSNLAVGWMDGRVELWDVVGRNKVVSLVDLENDKQAGIATFSPVEDLVVATSGYKELSLYRGEDYEPSLLWRLPQEGWWTVRCLNFSKDGSKIVVYAGSLSGQAGVWVLDIASRELESFHPSTCVFTWQLGAAILSPDGHRLYFSRAQLGGGTYTLQCLDLKTGREIWQSDPLGDQGVTALTAAPDGSVLVSASGFDQNTIQIWDADTGSLLKEMDNHTSFVSSLDFSETGHRMFSSSQDQTLRNWDTTHWNEIRILRGHHSSVSDLAVSPSGKLLASVGVDGQLNLWNNLEDASDVGFRHYSSDMGWDRIVPFEGRSFLALSPGKVAKWVDLGPEKTLKPVLEFDPSTDVVAADGANSILTLDGAYCLQLNEWREGRFVKQESNTLTLGSRPRMLDYNFNSQLVAWCESPLSKSIFIQNLAEPGHRMELKSDVAGLVSLKLSNNGRYLVAATEYLSSGRLWDLKTGDIVSIMDEPVSAASFALDGQVIFSATQRGKVILFSDLMMDPSRIKNIPIGFPCWSLTESPDGRWVAGGTLGGIVYLLNAANGEVSAMLDSQLGGIRNCSFSPDGKRLISTSAISRHEPVIWDMETGQELITLKGGGGRSFWSMDGNTIFFGLGRNMNGVHMIEKNGISAWVVPSLEQIDKEEWQ